MWQFVFKQMITAGRYELDAAGKGFSMAIAILND